MTQVVPDSLQVAPDSAAVVQSADSLQPALSTRLPFDELLTEAANNLYAGQYDQALNLVTAEIAREVTLFAPRLFVAFLLVIVLYLIYRILYKVLRGVLHRTGYIRPGLETLVLQGFRLACLIGIGLTALQSIGIKPAGLLAGIGVVGIALGIAARDTVENIISGVSILADGAIKIGDVVIFNDTYCEVKEITLRTTRLRTPKNETLIVPNRQMANDPVRNHTVGGNLRIEIPFSIAYREFPQQARTVVLRLPVGDTRLSRESEPEVIVTSLNDSSIDMMLWVYVNDPSREREIIYDYTERIREALREANIEIPFPHMQVVMES